MNDQQRAAMQMALEALEGIYIPDGLDFIADWWPKCRDSITALRDALAQPQDMKECRHCGWLCKPNDAPSKKGYVLAQPQEPVAKVDANDEGVWADILPDRDVKVGQLLYAAPPSVEAIAEWYLIAQQYKTECEQDIEAMRIETLEKAADLREQIALQGVQSSWYEDGFWDGLVAYEQAIRSMK